MSDTRILPCTISDLHTLQDIAINSYGDHYLYLWHDGGAWYLDKCFSEEALKKELEDANAAFFLIYDNDELVGFLKLNVEKGLEGYAPQDCLELERVYLLKSASGKGIGTEVLTFTKQFAKDRNKNLIWLKAMDSSQLALQFYKQHGFTDCGTHQLDFEAMKEEYRGMYVLKLEL